MKTLKGTVKKSELEGGIWIFETDNGEIFQIKGGPVELYREGLKTTLKGTIRKDILGIGMVGPILEVREMV